MKSALILAGLMAAAIPAAALAQPEGCVRQNQDNRVAGTVAGAVIGGLIGNSVSGHDRGAGTVAGAVVGGVAGNAIAGANNQPCPQGYVRVERRDGPPPPPPGPPPGRRDFWYGAPVDVHARIDFMQDRIERATRGGWLSRREVRDINGQMQRIRMEDRRLTRQDYGRLRPEDAAYLQSMLDNLSQRLHWAEHN